MKQTFKRFYGTLGAIAIVSGITGAFAYSFASSAITERDGSAPKKTEESQVHAENAIMTLSNSVSMPSQPVDLTVAAEKACNAVVYIKVVTNGKTQTIEYRDPFDEFFGDFFGRGNGGTQRRQIQTPKREGAGSGVIISADGYIVTNNHVVENADNITITLNDNREFTAKTVGTDPTTDLALLKIEGTDLPTLVIGDSDALKVGEWVLAVGNPFNLNSTVTAGIVSAKARSLGANGIESFIQTDAAINKGNSGGALVNARGELVGINAMLYSQTGSYTGYGFAIPTTIMKKVVTDIKEYGTVQRALLGISGIDLHRYIEVEKRKDENFEANFGTNIGVYVDEVIEDGAAAEAGIKSGDIIIAVDGKTITKMSELQESITKYRPGDKALIGFIRNKKEKSATITFRNEKGTTKVVKAVDMDILGAEFKELSESQKKSLDMTNGVQVAKIKDGRMKEAGITEGFIILKVNNQNIRNIEDLQSVFKSASSSDEQTLWIWGKSPSGKAGSYAVYIGEE